MHVDIKHELKESKPGLFGIILLAVLAVIALAAPLLACHNPAEQTALSLQSPSLDHLLGTNQVGQDIFSRLLYGARTSLLVGFCSAAISTFLSAVIGVSAALIGGLYDRVMMRIVDAFLIIPHIIMVVLIAAYLRPNIWNLIIIISLFGWQAGARIVRAQTLSIKEHMHISAARCFGAGHTYIMLRHILPDLVPILVVEFIYGIRRAIFMEAGLAFIGITDPGMISWGIIIHNALRFSYLNVWQWWLLPTGIVLSLTILSVAFIGHAIEPVVDPRLKKGEQHA